MFISASQCKLGDICWAILLKKSKYMYKELDIVNSIASLLQENTRLQSKVVRLNLGSSSLEESSASPSYLEDLKDLKEENAELREDNDKLLSYLDGLEERKKELEAIVASRPGKQIRNMILRLFI